MWLKERNCYFLSFEKNDGTFLKSAPSLNPSMCFEQHLKRHRRVLWWQQKKLSSRDNIRIMGFFKINKLTSCFKSSIECFIYLIAQSEEQSDEPAGLYIIVFFFVIPTPAKCVKDVMGGEKQHKRHLCYISPLLPLAKR